MYPQPLQTEAAVSLTGGIGKQDERPLLKALVSEQKARLGERDHDDRHARRVKLPFHFLHLPEVLLASESGQVAEKNEKTQVVQMIF